jgi:anti-sigma factor RsiW
VKKNCRKHFDRISEYLDGELDDALCREIEAHLRDCPECRECIDSLRKTIRICRGAAEESVPEEVRIRLRAALRECMREGG